MSPKHLHRYLDEFTYRYNRKSELQIEVMSQTIQDGVGKRLRYRDLVA